MAEIENSMDSRHITKEELETLKPFSKKRKAWLWGHESETTPTIVHTVFGDGHSIITLEPTNDRPAYYVMLADSTIKCFEDALHFISYNEELVFQAIEEEYGNIDDQQYDEEGKEIEYDPYGDHSCEDGEMPLNIGSGYTAGYFDNQPLQKNPNKNRTGGVVDSDV